METLNTSIWSSTLISRFIFMPWLKMTLSSLVYLQTLLSSFSENMAYLSSKIMKRVISGILLLSLNLELLYQSYLNKLPLHPSSKMKKEAWFTLFWKNPKYSVNLYLIVIFKTVFRFPKIGKRDNQAGMLLHWVN